MGVQALMFHHFHGESHPNVLGAISAEEFRDIIRHVGREQILPAQVWLYRAINNELSESDLCLTLDDALLCQFDVAYPIMRELDLTAFWFVYSSVFEGNIEPLEVYRYFANTAFDDVASFYREFLLLVEEKFADEYRAAIQRFDPDTYLAGFPFYSQQDRVFRFVRDELLGDERYGSVMRELMRSRDFDASAVKDVLWMRDEHLKALHENGHVIGLHSYSHPTRLNRLPYDRQREEYLRNFRHIKAVLGIAPVAMSHPCNSYDQRTLEILTGLGVKVGFRSNMLPVEPRSKLEYMRKDHAILLQELRQ